MTENISLEWKTRLIQLNNAFNSQALHQHPMQTEFVMGKLMPSIYDAQAELIFNEATEKDLSVEVLIVRDEIEDAVSLDLLHTIRHSNQLEALVNGYRQVKARGFKMLPDYVTPGEWYCRRDMVIIKNQPHGDVSVSVRIKIMPYGNCYTCFYAAPVNQTCFCGKPFRSVKMTTSNNVCRPHSLATLLNRRVEDAFIVDETQGVVHHPEIKELSPHNFFMEIIDWIPWDDFKVDGSFNEELFNNRFSRALSMNTEEFAQAFKDFADTLISSLLN